MLERVFGEFTGRVLGKLIKRVLGRVLRMLLEGGGDWAGADTAYSTLICKVLCSSINH